MRQWSVDSNLDRSVLVSGIFCRSEVKEVRGVVQPSIYLSRSMQLRRAGHLKVTSSPKRFRRDAFRLFASAAVLAGEHLLRKTDDDLLTECLNRNRHTVFGCFCIDRKAMELFRGNFPTHQQLDKQQHQRAAPTNWSLAGWLVTSVEPRPTSSFSNSPSPAHS